MSISPALEQSLSPERARLAPAAYTVTEFCQVTRQSRNSLYTQWKQGIGPRYYLVGKHRRISIEAAADYVREREQAAQGSGA
jgi:hypothetical protein